MKRERLNPVLIACTGLLLLAIHLGLKQFTLNAQAWHMWQTFGHDPLSALLSGHPHGLRYVVYYPVFAAADFLEIAPDLAFSLACVIGLVLMTLYVGRIVSDLWGYSGFVLRRDIVTVATFAIAVLMNGRMILPFLGYLLVIFVGVDWLRGRKWSFDHAIALSLGLTLTSLSSGALPVAMVLTVAVVAIAFYRAPARMSDTAAVSIIAVLLLFTVPAFIGIAKNIAYFGGDIVAPLRMVEHGTGGAVIPAPVVPEIASIEPDDPVGPIKYWWVAALLWGGVAWWRGWRPVQAWRSASPGESVLQAAIALALAGGIFAYSVLTLGLVPLLILSSPTLAAMVESVRRLTLATAQR